MHRLLLRIFLALTIGAAGVLGVGHARAQAEEGVAIESVRVGLANHFKVGVWTPVAVELKAGSQPVTCELEIATPDSDGGEVTYRVTDERLQMAAGSSLHVMRYIKPGRIRGSVTVRVRSGERVVETQIAGDEMTPGLVSTAQWTLVLGPEALLNGLQAPRNTGVAATISRLTSADDFPDAWQGLEGVDSILLTTREPEVLAALSERQWQALERWCKLGGHLTVAVGESAGQVLAAEQPLRRLVGGELARSTSLRNTAVLESFVEASQRISVTPGAPLAAAILTGVPGKVELSESLGLAGASPLITRRPFGFGQIAVVAFDIDHPALATWPSFPTLLTRILTGEAPRAVPLHRDEQRGQVTHLGYTDLVGQLRAAMDRFPGVILVQFSWVAGLLVAYIALVGPLDYLLLRRLGGQMHWTWITLPFLVLVFCGAAVGLQGYTRGGQSRLNQVELYDLDVETGLQQGLAWIHVYSPKSQRLSLKYRRSPPPDPAPGRTGLLLSWHGLPGQGLGGLDTGGGSPLAGDDFECLVGSHAAEDQAALHQLPMPAGATRSLVARWWFDPADVAPPEPLTADEHGLLHGEVRNPFPHALRDCLLFYENWAYRFDRPLAPGQTVIVDALKPLNLQWRLTRRRVVEHTDVTTPWEQSSTEIPRILEMLMFHGVAGGSKYTHLSHRYQPYVDFSSHLNAGRAILVGQTESPVGSLVQEGNADLQAERQSWTYCRALLPVTHPSH